LVEQNGIEHARPALFECEVGDTPTPPWSTVLIPFSYVGCEPTRG